MQNDIMKPKVTFGSSIRFTPYAWSKLLWMRDRGDTEVAGYCVTGTNDPLLVTDFVLVKQECTSITFDINADDGAEYMEKMADKGLMPWQYSNILAHTHPGDSPSPSGVDEQNFTKAFSHPNWAIMFIIADGGDCYCRLKINVGPGAVKELNVCVDWKAQFDGCNQKAWEEEYKSKVQELKMNNIKHSKLGVSLAKGSLPSATELSTFGDDPIWWDQLSEDEWNDAIPDNNGQQSVIDDISEDIEYNCHWDKNGDVYYWDTDEGHWYSYDPLSQLFYQEDIEKDQMIQIDIPDEVWAVDVVLWAAKYANERVSAMEVEA